MKKLKYILIFFLFLACGKGQQQKYIPDVYVSFQLFPNSINYITPGGWLYVEDQGYKGIIIYRQDQYNFIAYERACTFDPDLECAIVEVDSSSFMLLIDSCCMSKFLILDGSPIEGPAIRPLKQYQTNFDGTTLYVTNTSN